MRYSALLLILLALCSGLAPSAGAQTPSDGVQTPFRPVAKVNDSIITAWEVDQRARILQLTGRPDADRDALANAALDALIRDRLKMQAGRKAGIEPDAEMIREGLSEMADRIGMSAENLRAALREEGVSDQAIDDMVGAQIVWRNVVRERFRSRVQPGEAEIDAEIALAGEQLVAAFRLSEIGLAETGAGRTPEETRALAARLVNELRGGAEFAGLVDRYSDAPSAREGGMIGWVPADQLPPEMRSELARMPEGGVTDPLDVQSGISILRLEARRERNAGDTIDASDPGLRERVTRRLINQRLERLAQGLLQDLRRDALIRVQ